MGTEQGQEVIVVGAGIYGASVAFYLAKSGVRTTLLERGYPAAGPTGLSSANVRLFYMIPELAELSRRSLAIFQHFGEVVGGDAGYVRTGIVYAPRPAEAPAWRAQTERLRAQGFGIEVREPDALNALLPGFLLDGVTLGVYEPDAGYADPAGTTASFANRAKELGATVRVRTEVARLQVHGGRITGVETVEGERFSADIVIVAAGPWTKGLVRQIGVELPLHVERHTITILDAPSIARTVMPVVWSDRARSYYARPDGEDSILVGGQERTSPVSDPDHYRATTDLAEDADLASRISTRVPHIAHLGIRRGYAGLYDCSPDRQLLVGQIPGTDGLYVIAGSSGHGFKLAPAVAEEAARLVTSGKADLLAPFNVDRQFIDPDA